MIWLKRLCYGALSVISVLLILVTLLGFTHWGNKWLWQQAKTALPALKGELVAGQLGYGWTLENVGWQDDLVQVSVARAVLDWDLGQLLKRRLWIKQLALTTPVVKVGPLPAPSDEPTAPFVWPPLPISIEVDALTATDFALRLPGVEVAFAALDIGAVLDKQGLRVRGPQLDKLAVTLASATPAAASTDNAGAAIDDVASTSAPASSTADTRDLAHSGKAAKAAKASSSAKTTRAAKTNSAALALPMIALPFPVQISGLQGRDLRYQQGEMIETVALLQLDAHAAQSDVAIERLVLHHPWLHADLAGTLRLSEDYPLDLTLAASAQAPLLDGLLSGQQARLHLSGSVADLALNLAAKGQVNAELIGTLKPLEAALPFDLKLTWPQLNWPWHAVGPEDFALNLGAGTVALKGALADYQLTLATAGEGHGIPPFKVDLATRGNLSALEEIRLELNALAGTLTQTGRLSWQEGITWQGKTVFSDLRTEPLLKALRGRFSGEIDSQFALQGDSWQLAVPTLRVNGRLNDYPLQLSGAVRGDHAMAWQFDDVRLSSGENGLTVAGALTPSAWQLDAELKAPQLSRLYPGLGGDLSGRVALRGNPTAPQLEARLAAGRVSFAAWQMHDLELTTRGRLKDLLPAGEVSLTLARLSQGASQWQDLALTAEGDSSAHQLALRLAGEPVAAELALTGALAGDVWQGRLSALSLDTPLERWALAKPWPLQVNVATATARLGELCLASQQASFCAQSQPLSAKNGQVDFALRNFDLARLAPWLPETFRWQAQLALEGRALWQGERPTLQARIRTGAGSLLADGQKTDYEQLSLGVEFTPQAAKAKLDFASRQIGVIDTGLIVTDPTGRAELSGKLNLSEFNLASFAPLIPEVRSLKGAISANGRFAGSLKAPLLYGRVALENGDVETYSDMVSLKKVTTVLAIDGNRATLEGSLLVGQGPLKLGGWLSWAQLPVSGELTIQGKELEAQYPGMGRIKVSPDLAIALGKATDIRGRIDIPWARILVKSLPDSAIALSDDVVIANAQGEEPRTAPTLPLSMNIDVVLGDDIKLDAMGLKTDISGQIAIEQLPEQPLGGTGQLLLTNGRFKAYGQNLLIDEGKILFSGPLTSPYLNIEANRDPETIEGTVKVGVRVTGAATKPELAIYSDPPMAQAEQLSYLLRGKGLQTSGSKEEGGIGGLLVAGAVSKAGGAVSSIGEKLGMRDVAIDTIGSGDSTQVTLSAYLLPGLQFQYGVGVFSPIAEFKLRYELMPRLYLQVMNGAAQAVDLFYRFTL
ncbi:MAG: autotransporter assembly complex protein TamB [Aeromonas sp.]